MDGKIIVAAYATDTEGLQEVTAYDPPAYWGELSFTEKKQALSDIVGTARVNP
jgi:hypothetical protein